MNRTVDLSTTYLGLKLRTPLVPSASPLSEAIDDIKKMEDADVTMLCSVLMRRGVEFPLLEQLEYHSLGEIKDLMSQQNCSDPSAFERAQYLRVLSTYEPLFLQRK